MVHNGKQTYIAYQLSYDRFRTGSEFEFNEVMHTQNLNLILGFFQVRVDQRFERSYSNLKQDILANSLFQAIYQAYSSGGSAALNPVNLNDSNNDLYPANVYQDVLCQLTSLLGFSINNVRVWNYSSSGNNHYYLFEVRTSTQTYYVGIIV